MKLISDKCPYLTLQVKEKKYRIGWVAVDLVTYCNIGLKSKLHSTNGNLHHCLKVISCKLESCVDCRERVQVKGFGVFLLILYPGAFVDIATDQLLSLSAWQQLRIFCAGVWHNFVIAVIALVVLLCLPTLLAPFYVTGQTVLVTALTEVLM